MKFKLLAFTFALAATATLACAQDAASTPFHTGAAPTVETAPPPIPEETPTPPPAVQSPPPAAPKAVTTAPKEEEARPSITPSPVAATRASSPAPARKPTPKPSAKPEPAAPIDNRDDGGGGGSVIKALEREWEASIVKHDPSVIERLVADDFVGVSSAGKVGDKLTLLYEARRDKSVYKTATARQMSVHTYSPNVAVVLGITKESGTDSAGRAFDHTYRFTDTWMLRGGKWQCIAAHAAAAARR